MSRVASLAAGLIAFWTTATAALAQPVLITGPTTLNPGATTITPTAGGTAVPLATADITVSGGTLTVNGRHTIRSLVVQNNGLVTHAPGFTFDYSGGAGTDVVNGLWLNVQANPSGGDVTIEAGSRIDVSARGYDRASGPGAGGGLGQGGSHGGSGGLGGGPIQGSITQPTSAGSGGTGRSCFAFGTPRPGELGTLGGGVVRLVVSGGVTMNGTILSDGESNSVGCGNGCCGASGGGAGGSIWITAGSLTGTGLIRASGGNGSSDGSFSPSGGGGGGRISIETPGFTISAAFVQAYGGTGVQAGGPGTIYGSGGGTPELVMDNHGRGGILNVLPGAFNFTGNVSLERGAAVTHPVGPSNSVSMSITGNLSIDSQSGINVSARGYDRASGPGAGNGFGQGGSHGGSGGLGGPTNGSITQPTSAGSGGTGRSCFAFGTPRPGELGTLGGGVVRLSVSGSVTMNGTIQSDGDNNSVDCGNGCCGTAGGGAGGSIWITAGSIAGTGLIRASGGNGAPSSFISSGGGGGGRIAIYTCALGLPSVNTSVSGGPGAPFGQPGTIYLDTDAMLIRAQPAPSIPCPGSTVLLEFDVLGAASFQWSRDGVPLVNGPTPTGAVIAGSQSSVLSITGVVVGDDGVYRCTATNACASLESDAATLTPCPANFNCDGTLDPDDLADYVGAYFAVPAGPGSDFNNDGATDPDDLADFIGAFFTGC